MRQASRKSRVLLAAAVGGASVMLGAQRASAQIQTLPATAPVPLETGGNGQFYTNSGLYIAGGPNASGNGYTAAVTTNVPGAANPTDQYMPLIFTGPANGTVTAYGNQYYLQCISGVTNTNAVSFYNLDAYQTLNFDVIFPPPGSTDPAFNPNGSLTFTVNLQGSTSSQSTISVTADTSAANTVVPVSVDISNAQSFGDAPGEQSYESLLGSGYLNLYIISSYGYNGADYMNDGFPTAPLDGQTFYLGNISFSNPVPVTNATWSGSGSWSNSGNWSGGVIPTNIGDTATFGASANTAVTLDGNFTVASVVFDNTSAYHVSAGNNGVLTLEDFGGTTGPTGVGGNSTDAFIAVNFSGTNVNHVISAPIVLDSTAVLTVVNPGDGLTISGNISGPGGIILGGNNTYGSSGTVTLSGSNSYAGSTSIYSGTLDLGSTTAIPSGGALVVGGNASSALLRLSPHVGTFSIPFASLTLNAGSSIDVTSASLAFKYTGASPITTIQSMLATGYNGGAWNGPGIISSSALASGGKFGIAYSDSSVDKGVSTPAGEVLLQYDLIGDTNLDGSVNLTDLLALLNNYGLSGKDWVGGDFNYDGTVNLTDLLALLNNYGLSGGLSNSSVTQAVPEPASLSLLALGGVSLLARRRRPC